MALKDFRPLTPTQRFKQTPAYSEITKAKPEKSLVAPLKRTGGRNNNGRLTSRHIGGGHKRKYRIIDFKRKLRDVEAVVEAIEYDPNRSSRIALLHYSDGTKAYILAPVGLEVGAKVIAGQNVPPEVGNALPLKFIPLGTVIDNVEIIPGRGGQLARSAGRVRCLFPPPHVRGMSMNPIDHPMGGGQGKSKGGGGRHHPVSPWGQLAKGFKTRAKRKPSDRFILERCKAKKKI